jgi:hypothetical protein
MFSVLEEAPGRYRLGNGPGGDAGWIRGKAIGFRGLRNEAEAIVAASAGWRTLQSLLHREYSTWPRQEVGGPARRLAVEFVVPAWMSDESVIPLAHALWHVLAPLLTDTSRTIGGARRASLVPPLLTVSRHHHAIQENRS